MKQYKVLEAKSALQAEEMMNAMAREGWTVKTVTYWAKWTYRLVITFERDAR